MSQSVLPAQRPRVFTARRLALLAGVAGLSATVLFVSPGFLPKASFPPVSNIAYAQSAQRPVGFADIVEKVKPAVISVRVKMNAGARVMSFEGNSPFQQGSPMDRFFRRFGTPDGATPNEPRTPGDPRTPGEIGRAHV